MAGVAFYIAAADVINENYKRVGTAGYCICVNMVLHATAVQDAVHVSSALLPPAGSTAPSTRCCASCSIIGPEPAPASGLWPPAVHGLLGLLKLLGSSMKVYICSHYCPWAPTPGQLHARLSTLWARRAPG